MNPDAAPSDQVSLSEPPNNAGPANDVGAGITTSLGTTAAQATGDAAAGQTGEQLVDRRVTVGDTLPALQVGSDDSTVAATVPAPAPIPTPIPTANPLPVPQTAPASIPAPTVGQTSSAPAPTAATRGPIPSVVSIGSGSTVNWQSLVNGLAGEAESAWKAVLGEIPELAADPDEAEELQYALAELVAVGAAHVGLAVDDEEKLRRRYLAARAIVSNNAAVKAKEAEAFVLQTVGRIFARATDMVVYGISRAGVAAVVAAL